MYLADTMNGNLLLQVAAGKHQSSGMLSLAAAISAAVEAKSRSPPMISSGTGVILHSNDLLLQVAAAREQASNMLSQAAAIAAAVEAEAQVQQVQAGLRDQEEQASAAVKVHGSRISVRTWPCVMCLVCLQ